MATQALIVGAGPTGLVAACELAARGVPCRVIDKAPQRSDKSRALIVQPRTLEILAQMGIADDLIAEGQRSLSINLHVEARRVASIPIDDIGVTDTRFPFLLFVSQVQTERLLEAKLEALGVRVERPVELVALRQETDGVVAELSSGGRREEARASHVIGADGAHSTVRHAAGLPFLGDRYPQDFILADVDMDWQYPHGGVHLFLARQGVLACLPMNGSQAYRLIATRSVVAGDAEPTLEEVRQVAQQMTGSTLRLENPRWLARFKLHHRGVDHYRSDRLFVAGDAAHIHSPAGGQGMNTGMQDAYNLAWKLALVLQRQAPEALLDSYEAERHPVGKRLLQTTDRLFRFGSSSSWLIAQLRRMVVPRVAPRVLGNPKRRARAFRFISQLGIRYHTSPLSNDGAATGRGLRRHAPAAGQRAPDGRLDNGKWLLACLEGLWFHLVALRSTGKPGEAEALRQVFATFDDVVRVRIVTREPQSEGASEYLSDRSGTLHERYGVEDSAFYLIRPDGYIAQRCGGDDPAPLLAWLDRHVGRPSRRTP